MKKYTGLFFAAAMIFSIVFISEAISSDNPFAAQAQVKVKKRSRSVGSRIAGGGKYIYRKAKNGGYYVYRKTASGTRYVGRASVRGGKYVAGKSVRGAKYVGGKTVKGTKSVFSKSKKVVTGEN